MAKNSDVSKLLEDIWPQEREVFFRPERLKYVRRIAKPKSCVFCDASKAKTAKDKKNKLVVYQSKNIMVVLNKYPYNNGHLLILPTRHEGHLENLNDKEAFEIQKVLQASVKILKENYNCSGLNVGLNLGSAAGGGIPEHLHYHVVPRWNGDTNFFPLIAETKVVVETLETTFDKLIKPFSKLEKGSK